MKNTEYFLIVLNVPMMDSENYRYIPKPNKGLHVNLQRHQKKSSESGNAQYSYWN